MAEQTEKTPASGASSGGGVQSVERVLDLLEVMTDAGGSLALSELAERAGLPHPTIHRLLRTLVGRGYVRQLPNRRYSLGPRLIRLGDGASTQLGVHAKPRLAELVTELEESANMAVREGNQVLYIAQAPSPHTMRMFTEVGRRAPMHNTGVGKAILSQLDDRTVRGIIEQTGMEPATEKSLRNIDELLADLQRIRERGYAIDDNEQEIGVRCFSVPVPHAPTPTAISVSGPTSRVDEAFGKRAVPLLQAMAQRIGSELSEA